MDRMGVQIKSFTGQQARPYLKQLARLRIEVFREYPYLYDGNWEYEQKYLETFTHSDQSLVVVALDGAKVVGASTGIPLAAEPEALQNVWKNTAYSVHEIFYFSESVLQKEYRGQGIGVQFFQHRETWAQSLGFRYAVFCGVIRAANDPRRPAAYQPLDRFWQHRGYSLKPGVVGKISWKEVDEIAESEKELQFWMKQLD